MAGTGVSSTKPRLGLVIASTRPGRVGLPVARWLHGRAREHGGFDIDLIDLAQVDLPLLDEPEHPRLRRYQHDHTKAWSARVDALDAFAFVMPEYNHGFNAALKNAIDYLNAEWRHKPAGFVSYGGVAGGTRAVQMLKPVLTVLRMVPVAEAVTIPGARRHLDDNGEFQGSDELERAAKGMFDALLRWTEALASLRVSAGK